MVWFSPNATKSIKLVQDQFQPRPDDVILATYPKCGTTWLKALAFTVINRTCHPVAGDEHPLLTNNPHGLVPYLELPHRHLCPITELEALPSPRLLGTHIPFALLPSGTLTHDCRVVYLCREPKDVFVSFWHHVQKVIKPCFMEFDKAFEFFCEGFSLYGPIWEHYLGYWRQSSIEPSNVLFLKYDEMMVSPAKHVKMLAEFLRVPFTEEEEHGGVVEEVVKLCSFEKLKSLPVNSNGVVHRLDGEAINNSLFFRNAKVEDWANYLTEEMAQKLNDIIEEKLKGNARAKCYIYRRWTKHVSYIQFDKAFEFFCEGFSIYGPIWEHYLGYWKQSSMEPSKVLILKYDEKMSAPAKHVKGLAKFLGVPFTDEECGGVLEKVVALCSFEKLKNLPVNSDGVADRIGQGPTNNSLFFRNAKVGDWENHLTEEMAQKLDSIIEEKIKGLASPFDTWYVIGVWCDVYVYG
ncbi:hypothetical protein EJB05_48309, partial [Eragrostis curvula]